MQIKNRVKDLKTCDAETFLSWEFNTLKDKERDVSKLKKAILKGGFSFPVIVWQKFVIDGAGRRKAVEQLVSEGHELSEIPYVEIEAKDLDEAKQKALEVSSSYGDITKDSFLEFTKGMDLDFGTFEIDGISEDILLEDDDKDDIVPSVPKDPKSKLGDLYILGNHRLLCGDSTSEKDVALLMDGAKADMIFTDPPYNVNYSGRGKETSNTIMNDSMSKESFDIFLDNVFKRYSEISKAGAGWYVFHSTSTQAQFQMAIERTGWKVKMQIVWNKPTASMGWGDYRWKHEPMYYCGKENTQFYGDRTHTSVWDLHGTEEELIKWAKKELKAVHEGKTSVWTMKRDSVAGYVHPTQKPVELITYALKNSSKQDDIVVDLFGGSGSTLIACEKAQRTCYTMELDQKFVDVIVTRYCQYVESTKVILNGEEINWEPK
jgi:DNA modification methylase